MTSRRPAVNCAACWLIRPGVEIVGEAANIEEAAGMVESLTPDLLFLDIQMPGGSGFDLLTRLEHVPAVIFTTAHDEHAVRAFEVDALDYLLKPIDPASSRRGINSSQKRPGGANTAA